MYQPQLLPRQIRALYLLKKVTGRSMTSLAREAIDSLIASAGYEVGDPRFDHPIQEKGSQPHRSSEARGKLLG